MDQFMKAFKLNLSKVEKLTNFNANFLYLVLYKTMYSNGRVFKSTKLSSLSAE